jgi:hypothetical protein
VDTNKSSGEEEGLLSQDKCDAEEVEAGVPPGPVPVPSPTCNIIEDLSGAQDGDGTTDEDVEEEEVEREIRANVDADLASYKTLQNYNLCGNFIGVPVNRPKSVALQFSRDEAFWTQLYPGVFMSNQDSEDKDDFKWGMIEICPRTIRPFEVLPPPRPMV